MSLGIVRSQFVALWLETILYGGFLALFAVSLYFLFKKGRVNDNKIMTLASILMFFLITAHVACNLVTAIKGFTTDRKPLSFYSTTRDGVKEAKCILFYLISIVGDAIVVYRCWIVWNGRPMVMFLPCALYLATIVIGGCTIKYLTENRRIRIIAVKQTCFWPLMLFSFSFATNVLCTSLIASRIWLVMRRARFNSGLFRVSVILIESASVYSLMLLVLVLTAATKDNAQLVVLDALPPIIGLVFESIIVVVGLGLSAGSNTHWSQKATVPSNGDKPFPTEKHNISLGSIQFGVPKSIKVDSRVQDSSQGEREVVQEA